MSRGNDEVDSELEKLLESAEKAEAEVLRRELTAFLKSPEARNELGAALRPSLESLVQQTLKSPEFRDELRDQLVKALTPKLAEAAKAAVASAMRDVQIVIDKSVQTPRFTPQYDEPSTPRPNNPWQLGALILGAVLVAVIVYALVQKRDRDPEQAASAGTTSQEIVDTTRDQQQPAPAQPQPSRLFEAYRGALSHAIPTTLPPPTAEELRCIERGVAAGETTAGRLDVTALHHSLTNCAATAKRPSGASPIVATVQAQLTEEARSRTCSGLQPLEIDGLAGSGTAKALKQYAGCTVPTGVPTELATIADYAAVGVYFIDRRMHEN